MRDDSDFLSPAAEWPDGFPRCPDELFEEAYNSVPASFRGAVKTALAAAFFHFGQDDSRRENFADSKSKGFWRRERSVPASWTLVAFSKSYAAPARLAAACVLPALCGVPLIGACSLGGAPAPAILATLELCGVEDVFTAGPGALDGLLAMPGGRLVLLDHAERELALERRIPCYEEERAPRLFVDDPESFDMQTLALAQGRSASELARQGECPLDCLYSATAGASSSARLTLHPGLEAFWLLPGLSPRFFRETALEFGAGGSEVPG